MSLLELFFYISILVSGYIISLIVLYRSNKIELKKDKCEQRCKALEEENKKLEHEVFRLAYVVPKFEKKE